MTKAGFIRISGWVPSDSNSWPDWCIYTACDIYSNGMTITQSDKSKPDQKSENQIKVMAPVESKLLHGTDGFEHNCVRVPPGPPTFVSQSFLVKNENSPIHRMRSNSKWRHLLQDEKIRRWYDNVARGSRRGTRPVRRGLFPVHQAGRPDPCIRRNACGHKRDAERADWVGQRDAHCESSQ